MDKEYIELLMELAEEKRKQRNLELQSKMAAILKGDQVPEEEEKEEILDESWTNLLEKAKNISTPSFSSNSLGDKVLDYALDKKVNILVPILGISSTDIRKRIWAELKANRVARRTAVSTIRFLRDVSVELFLECPECGYINLPEWQICEQCGTESD